MTDPIISLCYISDIRDNSLVLLDRIADFCDDHFEAYQPVAVSNIGSDRNRIIGFTNRINAPEGSIGVYEWYAFEDGERWKTDIHPISASWTEVIPTNYASPKEIIASLRQGWKYAHALEQQDFIVCCKQTGSVLLGVRFPADSISHDGNMCTIADDVIQVEVGTIRTSDLFSLSAQKRYVLLDTQRWVKSKDEFVMSIDEIISKIAGGLIGKIDKSALTRKERQAARSALSKLSAQTIEQTLAMRLGCTEEEAHQYVVDYLTRCQIKLNENQIESFVQLLVDGDSQAVEALRKRVEEDWQSENTSRLAEARQNIDAAKNAYDEILKKQDGARAALAALKQEKQNIEKQVEKDLQLQADVEAEINKRLTEIRAGNAAELVNHAFLDAAITQHVGGMSSGKAGDSSDCVIRYADPDGEIPNDSLSENYAVAVEALENYCTSELDNASKLMLYLFASYVCKQHLVITGETAETLAFAYSSSIVGFCCPVVFLADNSDVSTIVRELKNISHPIVAVREASATCYEYLREIMRQLPEKQFIRLLDHEESLLMEPASLYTTFLPVLTDMFCKSTEISIPDGFSCLNELAAEKMKIVSQKELAAAQVKWHKLLGRAAHSPLLESRCTQLHIAMQHLAARANATEHDVDAADIIYLYAPLMKCLRRTEELMGRLKLDSTLSNTAKDFIKNYCGVEDD